NVLVLTGRQPRTLFDDGDLRAEAAVHLRELERYVTTADDHQMFWQRVQIENPHVRQVVDVGKPRQLRHHGAAADVEKELVGLQDLIVDANGVRVIEAR